MVGRFVSGFVVAPLCGMFAAGMLILPWVGELEALPLYMLVGAIYALPSALLIGVPLYFLALRVFGALSLWHFVVGGLLAAVPSLYFVLVPENTLYFERTWLLSSLLCEVTGAFSGVALWLYLRQYERGMMVRSNYALERTNEA